MEEFTEDFEDTVCILRKTVNQFTTGFFQTSQLASLNLQHEDAERAQTGWQTNEADCIGSCLTGCDGKMKGVSKIDANKGISKLGKLQPY